MLKLQKDDILKLKGGCIMPYLVIKVLVYVVSIMLSMWGLSCFNFDNVIRKTKLREFYLFFLIASLALGYLLGSFILEFTTIHF